MAIEVPFVAVVIVPALTTQLYDTAPATGAMLYVLPVLPPHTDVSPVITPRVVAAGAHTVIDLNLLSTPHTLMLCTFTVSEVYVAGKSMVIDVPLVAVVTVPALTTQLYDTAPATGAILYTLPVLPAHTDVPPVMLPGVVATGGFTVMVLNALATPQLLIV